MRQRISVRAIIHRADSVLLLRRATGRPSILGLFELPGGKIGFREQPDDALTRYLLSDAGVRARTIVLKDVLTYTDPDDQNLQYVFIVYDVTLVNDAFQLSRNYDRVMWSVPSKSQRKLLTESTRILLSISSHPNYLSDTVDNSTPLKRVVIYTDGGSRGNPGPSAAGYVMYDDEIIVDRGGQYLGITTNNVAEYQAALLGLQKALEYGAQTVDFRMDSLLVVNQMNGIFKVKNRELEPSHEKIKLLENKFRRVRYVHVKRELNRLADAVVNQILDEHEGRV
jgi:ribonuclease HI